MRSWCWWMPRKKLGALAYVAKAPSVLKPFLKKGLHPKNFYFMVGMAYSAPLRMPVGQREVMVFSLV